MSTHLSYFTKAETNSNFTINPIDMNYENQTNIYIYIYILKYKIQNLIA